jgi:hypothetical protein
VAVEVELEHQDQQAQLDVAESVNYGHILDYSTLAVVAVAQEGVNLKVLVVMVVAVMAVQIVTIFLRPLMAEEAEAEAEVVQDLYHHEDMEVLEDQV